jgi:hypothetical protein
MIYCLKDPHGRLIESTTSFNRDECWLVAFEFIAGVEGDKWRNHYFPRWDASQRWARKAGYKIVKCELKALELLSGVAWKTRELARREGRTLSHSDFPMPKVRTTLWTRRERMNVK